LCDLGIEGTLESLKPVLCPFVHLRELDMDGSHLTGPIPEWIADCFPHLSELGKRATHDASLVSRSSQACPQTCRTAASPDLCPAGWIAWGGIWSNSRWNTIS